MANSQHTGWLTGKHAIEAAIASGARGTLFVSDQQSALARQARDRGLRVEYVPTVRLRALAGGAARGAALQLDETRSVGRPVVLQDWLATEQTGPVVVLDHITDPYNVGAIFRSCLLLGVRLVVVPSRRQALTSPVIHQASAGASAAVPYSLVTNLNAALSLLRDAGFWIYAADADGVGVETVEIDPRSVFVLGAEGKGLSPLLAKNADVLVAIPMAPNQIGVDSYNVSVSTALLLYEYRRRHSFTTGDDHAPQ